MRDVNRGPQATVGTTCCTIAGLCLAVLLTGCPGKRGGSGPEGAVISNSGSDTMVNLAQMWAQE